MTLDAQIPISVKPHMIFMIGAFGCMTTRTGHHLAGPRVEDILANRMGKGAMEAVTLVTDIIDRCLKHIGMVGAMRRMAVRAGARQFMLELCRVASFESVLMTGAADITLRTFEQVGLIGGVG